MIAAVDGARQQACSHVSRPPGAPHAALHRFTSPLRQSPSPLWRPRDSAACHCGPWHVPGRHACPAVPFRRTGPFPSNPMLCGSVAPTSAALRWPTICPNATPALPCPAPPRPARWLDARQQWGLLVNTARTFVRQAMTTLPEDRCGGCGFGGHKVGKADVVNGRCW